MDTRNEYDKRAGSRLALASALLVLLGGILVSVLLARAEAERQQERMRMRFDSEAGSLRLAVIKEVALFVDVLDSIRHLHSISEQVGAAEFEEFLNKGMRHQLEILGGFGFVQRLGPRERAQRRAAGGLEVLERNPSGGWMSAGERRDYYPLTYQTPPDAMGVPDGYDFVSDPASASTITELARNGQTLMVDRDVNGAGRLVFAPILYPVLPGTPLPVPPPGYLVGFAVARFDPQRILARIQSLPASGAPFQLSFIPDTHASRPEADGTEFMYQATIPVAGMKWLLTCRAPAAYGQDLAPGRSRQVFAVAFLITLLLALELFLLAGRARRVEVLVRKRTRDLQKAKNRIELAMEERRRLEHELLEVGNREKLRVGHDLHDSVGQKLAAAVFRSRALTRQLQNETHIRAEDAGILTDLLKDALSQIRRMARGLAPVELADAGLAGGLRQLAEQISETYQIVCRLDVSPHCENLSAAVAGHLYHIAQESLSNAIRHGKADHLLIVLGCDQELIRLTVTDNGTGLPPADERGAGMGLHIMRHRVELLGGTIKMAPVASGRGTVVTCEVPRNGQEAKQE